VSFLPELNQDITLNQSNRVFIAATGIGAFFLARKYVEGNRQQAMLARQEINFTLESEIARIRRDQQEAKELFKLERERKQKQSENN